MTRLNELSRDYEARHFPPTRRLDLQAEGPRSGRERALRWIQMWAHEEPGAELLLVLERGRSGAPTRPGTVRGSVEAMLDGLVGGLLEWWQPFTPGTVAVRIAHSPRMVPPGRPRPDAQDDGGDGRTPETAGSGYVAPEQDIPPELLPVAEHAAELRRAREGLSLSLQEVVLRRVWIEAQAMAMTEGMDWGDALERVLAAEERRVLGDE
ncbi:MAG: hypothetical protein M3409_08635 [Gemmatimonadota bacterium]|nr:hypothetical protein [Gemmatimonadota bacterium]